MTPAYDGLYYTYTMKPIEPLFTYKSPENYSFNTLDVYSADGEKLEDAVFIGFYEEELAFYAVDRKNSEPEVGTTVNIQLYDHTDEDPLESDKQDVTFVFDGTKFNQQ